MNPHLECVSRMDEARAGRLDPAAAAAWSAHLGSCALCRAWSAAWPAEAPVPDLLPGVRRGLAQAGEAAIRLSRPVAARRVPAWVPALGFAALCAGVLAFWHPERAWLRSGQAWWSACPGGAAEEASCCPR